MPVDLEAAFRQGGRSLVNLLEFCVMTVQMDPVFLFLVGEFRSEPTTSKALALYDVFLDQRAPARIGAYDALPPRNLQIAQAIHLLRDPLRQADEAARLDTEERSIIPGAPKYIFDATAHQVRRSPAGSVRKLIGQYDPRLSAKDNLPDGKMTAGARAFVDSVWQPQARPLLVSAGFRRIANIG